MKRQPVAHLQTPARDLALDDTRRKAAAAVVAGELGLDLAQAETTLAVWLLGVAQPVCTQVQIDSVLSRVKVTGLTKLDQATHDRLGVFVVGVLGLTTAEPIRSKKWWKR